VSPCDDVRDVDAETPDYEVDSTYRLTRVDKTTSGGPDAADH
jgi:hypothetical protein